MKEKNKLKKIFPLFLNKISFVNEKNCVVLPLTFLLQYLPYRTNTNRAHLFLLCSNLLRFKKFHVSTVVLLPV
jgi:hypothetical protein